METNDLTPADLRRLLLDARRGIDDARKHLRQPEQARMYLSGAEYRIGVVKAALAEKEAR
jgi:hypothetical protein